MKSKDFSRCVIILHALGVVVLFTSGLQFWFCSICVVMMLFSMVFCLYHGVPNRQIFSITHHANLWHLTRQDGGIEHYEHASVCFDGGLFFLLELRGEQETYRRIIFYDQITSSQWRYLKWH